MDHLPVAPFWLLKNSVTSLESFAGGGAGLVLSDKLPVKAATWLPSGAGSSNSALLLLGLIKADGRAALDKRRVGGISMPVAGQYRDDNIPTHDFRPTFKVF